MNSIKIGNRLIGDDEPCFIIAEVGVNHNGDINLAKALIDIAIDAGADAVKFQIFNAEAVVTKKAEMAEYQKSATGVIESQYEMLKRLELGKRDFEELADYAKERQIMFLSTPFDKESAELIYKLDLPAFKIGSGEITNLPFLRYIAQKKRPIILSTGMSTLGEVEEGLNCIQKEGVVDIILLHCVSDYPTDIRHVNLRAIKTLKYAFKLPVGFSDHTMGIIAPLASVALGSCMIEKHLTIDKSLPGPDHRASLDPKTFKNMVLAIKDLESSLGDGIKKPTESEENTRMIVRRSLVAKVDIPKGKTITEDVLDIKRPGTGIKPKYWDEIIGKKARENIKKHDVLTWGTIE